MPRSFDFSQFLTSGGLTSVAEKEIDPVSSRLGRKPLEAAFARPSREGRSCW
jgi:hypothetical protein